ncbi:MAG TPA: ribosome-associated translation inhibitor RaiA [Vicinamibacterales bacterium]|jgi:putative sigma-54 modulation protein
MRLDITGRHVEMGAPLRQLIDRRLAKLERLLNDSAISAQVVLTKEKYRHRAEIIVHARGDHMLRGKGEGTGWNISIREAVTKIEQQAQTLTGKWQGRKRRGGAARSVPAPPEAPPEPANNRRVIKAARYAVKPLSIEDAVQRLSAGPETFVVYRNADTDAVSILYRRTDGNYGLIEPD